MVKSSDVPLSAIADWIRQYESVRCVILNACESVKNMKDPIAPYTIGMDSSITDETSIEFSRGFYDALGVGKDIEPAYQEGINAVKLKGHDASSIKLLH